MMTPNIHTSVMNSKWTCKDLHRSATDVALNSLLFIFLVISYLPQINLILGKRNTSGILQTYILNGYLFTATQFTLRVLYASWHHPTIPCIVDHKLKGIDAWGAMLGVVQNTVLWLGSIVLVLLFYLFPNGRNPDSTEYHSASIPTTRHSISHPRYPKTILFLCMVHFSLWVLPILIIAIPRPNESFIRNGGDYFVGFAAFLLIPALMIMVLSQFPLQLKAVLSSTPDAQSSLSLATLAMQAVAFVLLGVSGKMWLGRPGDPFNFNPPYLTPAAQYRVGGWLYVNNIIYGIGQGLLLLASLWVKRGKGDGVWTISERAPLLGSD